MSSKWTAPVTRLRGWGDWCADTLGRMYLDIHLG